MSDYTGSTFISAPVEEELTGLTTLINDNKDANSATQALLDQEIYDRGAADTALQTDINTRALETALTAEASTRLQADEALSTRITNNSDSIGTITANLAQEVLDREAANTDLQNQINLRATYVALTAEVAERIDGDNALGVRITSNSEAIATATTVLGQEIYDRGVADTALQNQINERALQTALTTEASTRLQADEALSTRITNNSNAISTNAANIAQEIIDRGAADTDLQTQINTRALQMAAIDDRLTTEISTRLQADEALSTRITNNSNAISTDAANLAQEIIDRGAADTSLQSDINNRALQSALTSEIAARTTEDLELGVSISINSSNISTVKSDLVQEIADRMTADNTLQNNINSRALTVSLTNETTARTNADNSLQTSLIYEANSRINADINLQNQIDANETAITAEETARQAADTTLQASITANTTAIGTKANDIDVVKLSGNQTIDGEKFFTNDTRMGGDVILPTDEGKIVFGANNDRKIYWTAEGLGTNHAFQATRYNVAGGEQIASNNLADGSTLVKLLDGTVAIDGDVNITAGKAYKIDNVSIPTNADLALKAPIDNADLTGHTQMDRLSVNHSDSATIGLDFNNTNSNQYAGKFNTAAYGWRMFNNNAGIPGNTTFGVYTKGTGSQLNPLLVKNDGKLYTLDQEVDGDVNLSAGHEYKIDNVSIPTNADLALKAPIDNADLTGNTQMTRLTVNHSDAASIGLDFNNTNNNQYAGKFNTSAYGWRMFNNNTSLAGNTTFGVYTKGTGSQLNPLLVKNDGKLYTLDQEVDGDINLTTGHEFKINGVPLSSGGMTPEQEAELTSTTTKVDAIYDRYTPVTLQNVRFTNSVWDIGSYNTITHIQDAMAVGQVPQDRITNLPTDLAAKRAITDTSFNQFQLNGTTQYMTAAGGTINATDYFTEFDLTGLVNTDLVVGIQETDIMDQTKCIFIKTEDASNQTGNLIIRSNYLLTDQDIILRKKGDCVFLHADWDSSRWKVLGIFSNVQQTLTTTQSIVSERNVICQEHLFSNSAETTYIDGFTNINLRTPTSGQVPTISIDGQEAFMTKATTQTISGVKSFTSGIFSTEVSSKANFDLSLKTNDTDHKIDIANGSDVGLSQTLTKTSLNRALNIPYASVPLGTSTANKSPPTNSVSGDVYRDSTNALFIVP